MKQKKDELLIFKQHEALLNKFQTLAKPVYSELTTITNAKYFIHTLANRREEILAKPKHLKIHNEATSKKLEPIIKIFNEELHKGLSEEIAVQNTLKQMIINEHNKQVEMFEAQHGKSKDRIKITPNDTFEKMKTKLTKMISNDTNNNDKNQASPSESDESNSENFRTYGTDYTKEKKNADSFYSEPITGYDEEWN